MQNICTSFFCFNSHTILSGLSSHLQTRQRWSSFVQSQVTSNGGRSGPGFDVHYSCTPFQEQGFCSSLGWDPIYPACSQVFISKFLGCLGPRPAHFKPGCVWEAPSTLRRVWKALLPLIFFIPCVVGHLPWQRFQHTSQTWGSFPNSTSVHGAGSWPEFWSVSQMLALNPVPLNWGSSLCSKSCGKKLAL